MWLGETERQNESISDLRRRLSQDQKGILWDIDKWNCPVCSCTDRFHTEACSSDTHQYLRKNTDRHKTFFTLAFDLRLFTLNFPRCQGHYRAVHLPIQFLPVRSTSKPSLQVHLYVLSIFSHTPFWQMSGSRAHSLISEKAKNNLLNIRVGKKP